MDKSYCRRPPYTLVRNRECSEKQKYFQRRLLVILTFFLFLWAFLGFVRSDLFVLQEVEISGTIHTDRTEILLAMGTVKGENIWKISPSMLRGRVEAIARVDSVEIHRRLPRGLLVDVVEKKTVVLVPYGEYLLEVSADGQIIGSTQDPQKYALPLLTGIVPNDVSVGSYLLQGKQLSDLNSAINALNQYNFAVSELNFSQPENLLLVTMDGLVAWLGDSEYVEKADILAQISGQLQGKVNGGYLDLRVKEAPVFSPQENHVK
jgi:cell division protein FtsQ